jgi:class 3 adenylate cyclase
MPELSRESVTFFFTDIEGSTTLLQTLGDEYPDAVHEHRRLLVEAVEHAGGIVYGVLGDEVSAVFRTAPEAVTAASFGQRSFAAAAWPGGVNLRVRVGIHTGRPAGDPGEYLGLDVHRTARICSAGHGGQVLISEAVYYALGNVLPTGATFRDLGKHYLKDLPEPEHLFQLLIAGVRNEFPALRTGSESAPTSEFPGRARELAGSLRRAVTALQTRSRTRTLESEKVAPSEPLITPSSSAAESRIASRLPRPRGG